MNHSAGRLADYGLIAAPVDRFIRPPTQSLLAVEAAAGVTLPLPFFWHDPPWHVVPVERFAALAEAVGRCGVTVSAAEQELTTPDGQIGELDWPRMAVHRSDRVGWSLDDCQAAQVVEIRLGMERPRSGGYAYEAQRINRWFGQEVTQQAGFQTPVPLPFPPEWRDLSGLGGKVAQLRQLSDAAIFVSCDESQVEQVLPAVCDAAADGILVRFRDDPLSALQRCRSISDRPADGRRPRIWLSGGALDVEEMIKCFALGAAALSLDSLCDPWLVGQHDHVVGSKASSVLGFGAKSAGLYKPQVERITAEIHSICERLAAVMQALFVRYVTDLDEQHVIRLEP